jgi:hypothetical protein
VEIYVGLDVIWNNPSAIFTGTVQNLSREDFEFTPHE